MEVRNYYADGSLDRAAERRGDEAWLNERLESPASRFHPLWRGKAAVEPGPPPKALTVPRDAIAAAGLGAETILLGLRDGIAHFAVDASVLDDPGILGIAAERFRDLRDVGLELAADEAALLAYARGYVLWHGGHRFCGACGSPTAFEQAGHRRRCGNPECRRQQFPRTDPAVITLVTDGDRCLLARRGVWPVNRRSTIAGFVEPGEMLEDAVRREILEEVGVRVGEVRYHSSQPWPFPTSLMLGFTADALTTEIRVDNEEIVAADWYTAEDIARQVASGELLLPPPDSISRRLVADWLEGGD
jgi:NAD+ diphosphatase